MESKREEMGHSYFVLDDKPLEQPLSMFVEDVGTQHRETVLDQAPGPRLLLLHLQQDTEPHHVGLKLAQRRHALGHAALQAGHGVVLRLGLGDDEGAGVDGSGGGQRGLDGGRGPQQRQLACQGGCHPD